VVLVGPHVADQRSQPDLAGRFHAFEQRREIAAFDHDELDPAGRQYLVCRARTSWRPPTIARGGGTIYDCR
jgi:hypothetical protein